MLICASRILNVFSRDIYVLDQVLARVISGAIRTFSMVIGTSVHHHEAILLTRSIRNYCRCVYQLPAVYVHVASARVVLSENPRLLSVY